MAAQVKHGVFPTGTGIADKQMCNFPLHADQPAVNALIHNLINAGFYHHHHDCDCAATISS